MPASARPMGVFGFCAALFCESAAWLISRMGIVLDILAVIASVVLFFNKQIADKMSDFRGVSEWWAVAPAVLLLVFAFVRTAYALYKSREKDVFRLERENAQLKETRPKLRIALPEPEAIGVLDGRQFEIAVSNEPDHAASTRTRVSIQSVQPQVPQNVALPARIEPWEEDINPGDTVHLTVLQIQHGSTDGNPRAEAICSLFYRPLSLDLIHGAEQYIILYRVTANNLLRGIDFYCVMKRRTANNEYVWDVRWGLGSKVGPKK